MRDFVAGQGHALPVPAALLGPPPPRVIDENPPHHAGGDAEEVCAVAPLDLLLIDQPDVCFVDQGGWLQRMAGRLAPHVAAATRRRSA